MSTKKIENTSIKKSSSSPQLWIKFLLPILLVITTAVYFKSLNNQFTIWDDDGYVTDNPDIRTLHGDSIKYTLSKTFSTYVVGNYHPITMLTYCLEYQQFQLNPKPYHVSNLILHLLNGLLVFGFIWLLTKQQWTAFITSLLFSIHPMHVESVAWVAERKDVLYSFFYLTALCTYILYIKNEKRSGLFYIITLFSFCLAFLSKAMAVSLPLILFLIDYFFERKISAKTILEKLPFFILSFLFGYLAIVAQKSGDALNGITYYGFFDRILFVSYSIVMYLWKLIFPFNLSCFYNYPLKQDGWYPMLFYVSPLIICGLAFLVYRAKKIRKDLLFGLGFFFITITLVLQILPVGGALMADRYSYLPYIGLFFIIARYMNGLVENTSTQYRFPIISVFVIYVIICCFQSFQRTKVWHDSITLWTDAIKKSDEDVLPFKSRGVAYTKAKQYDKALLDFDKALAIRKDNPDVYYDRGVVYNETGYFEKAIEDYTAAIQYRPKFEKAYNNRGSANANIGRHKEAINDFSLAISLDSTFSEAYNNRGMAYRSLKKYKEALQDFDSAIRLNNKLTSAYCNKGIILSSVKRYDEAIQSFNRGIAMDPDYSVAYYHRGFTYYLLEKYSSAVNDYTSAINIDPGFIQAYFNRGIANYTLLKNAESIQDYSFVIFNNPSYGIAYYNRALAYEAFGKFDAAVSDVLEAQRLGYPVDNSYLTSLRLKIKK